MKNLAIFGGPKTLDTELAVPWPVDRQKDMDGLLAVANQKQQGKNGPAAKGFEERFAKYNQVKHCILCANGTVSLELILKALEIGRGDEVIIPAYTFVATASSVIYSGATPVFADIEPGTSNMSAESARQKITPRTKAIIPVYIGGRPADLDALSTIADEAGVYLIGDAAQAVGSQWRGKGIGSYGIAASFSCQNTKNLTSGEGGIITTNNDSLADKIRNMINGGKGADGKYNTTGMSNGISEWQAAILNSQMDSLDEQISHRMNNAAYLDSLLAEIPCTSPPDKDERITKNSYHLYAFRLQVEKLQGVTRRKFIQAAEAELGGRELLSSGYVPLYSYPCLSTSFVEKTIGCKLNLSPLKTVEWLAYHEALWLGHRTLLSEKPVIKAIADAISKVYNNLDELREEGQK